MQVGGQQHGEKYLSLQKIDPDVRFILVFFFFRTKLYLHSCSHACLYEGTA